MKGWRPLIRMVLPLTVLGAVAPSRAEGLEELDTYSIIARDPQTGELGEGVQSKAFAAGNRAMTARGGLAVIAHQAAANPLYGILGLELLSRGMTPRQTLDTLLRADESRERQQVAILDSQGRTAAWTGAAARDWKGHRCGVNYCAQGNILVGSGVLDAMARSFESSSGPLAERLLGALEAAQAAGGDARGMQSAALLVVQPSNDPGDFNDRSIDLRVDDSRTPLRDLRRLLDLFRSDEMIRAARPHLSRGQGEEALRQALAARDRSPGNDNAWVFLARVYLRLGRQPEALEAIRRAIELNPGNRRELRQNPEFQSLHDDPDFQAVVQQ